MLHFVASIATAPGHPGLDRAREALARRLSGWRHVLQTAAAEVWVQGEIAGRNCRRLGLAGCLIGADFGRTTERVEELLDQTWGAYVAFGVDAPRRQVTVQRDPTGRMECWRMPLDGVDLLFSHIDDVHSFQPGDSPIDWDYLGHHLSHDYLHGAATGVEGVSEVLPGEQLIYANGVLRREMTWRPHETAKAPWPRIEEARKAIRAASETCVEAWAGRYHNITLDLSGGLDSAIVLGLLRSHAQHERIVAINWLMPGREGDERPYARAAAVRHGVQLIEQPVAAIDTDFSTPHPRRLLRPRARLLPMGYDEIGADLARRLDSDAFFTGTGGDHLFYASLPGLAAADYLHHGGSLLGFAPTAVGLAQLSRDTVWGVAGAVLRHRFAPRPEAYEVQPWRNGFLSRDGQDAADPKRFTHPTALAAAETAPPAKLRQILNILELQRHYYRFGRAEAADETHVLFSQPVLDACLRTPAHWFGEGGVPRGLARQAFADLLPPEVLRRRSKGGNGVYWIRFIQDRLPRIRELLLEGRLAARGLLDVNYVAAALTPLGLAAGKDFLALNVCLTAELWIQQTEADWEAGRRERLAFRRG